MASHKRETGGDMAAPRKAQKLLEERVPSASNTDLETRGETMTGLSEVYLQSFLR
jgi:hypothetical protein